MCTSIKSLSSRSSFPACLYGPVQRPLQVVRRSNPRTSRLVPTPLILARSYVQYRCVLTRLSTISPIVPCPPSLPLIQLPLRLTSWRFSMMPHGRSVMIVGSITLLLLHAHRSRSTGFETSLTQRNFRLSSCSISRPCNLGDFVSVKKPRSEEWFI